MRVNRIEIDGEAKRPITNHRPNTNRRPPHSTGLGLGWGWGLGKTRVIVFDIHMHIHTHTHIYYIRTYVRTYIRMYVCMYVCMSQTTLPSATALWGPSPNPGLLVAPATVLGGWSHCLLRRMTT